MSNEFQHRLKESITNAGITASELSKRTGISEANISNYLNGKYVPKTDKCYLMASALSVDPGWLMTGAEPADQQDEHISIQSMDQFSHLLQYMDREEYDFVIAAFDRAYKRMKEKGVAL